MSIALKYWAFQQSGWGQISEPPAPEPEPDVSGGGDSEFFWVGTPNQQRPPLVFLDRGFITTLRLFTYVKDRVFAQEQSIVGPTLLLYNSTRLNVKDIQFHRLATSLKEKISPYLYESVLEKLNQIHDKATDPIYLATHVSPLNIWEYDRHALLSDERAASLLPQSIFTKEYQQIFSQGKTVLHPNLRERSSIIVGQPEGDLLTLVLQALAEQGEDITDYDDIEIDLE